MNSDVGEQRLRLASRLHGWWMLYIYTAALLYVAGEDTFFFQAAKG